MVKFMNGVKVSDYRLPPETVNIFKITAHQKKNHSEH